MVISWIGENSPSLEWWNCRCLVERDAERGHVLKVVDNPGLQYSKDGPCWPIGA